MALAKARSANPSAHIVPIIRESVSGMSVYRQSLNFVVGMAVSKLFPGCAFRTEHAFGLESSDLCTAYYGEIFNAAENVPKVLTPEQLTALQNTTQQIIQENHEIDVCSLNAKDALREFHRLGLVYACSLVLSQSSSTITVNRCEDYFSPHLLPLAPRTGCVHLFRIVQYADGIVLEFPSAAEPQVLPSLPPSPTHCVHRNWQIENTRWNDLSLGCVGNLNKAIMDGDAKELVHLCEAQQNSDVIDIAREIAKRNGVKMVLIGGPSSSGKTTFASKLTLHLRLLGVRPLTLSIDDYYRDTTDKLYPRNSEGRLDYENIEAIRLDLLNKHLNSLLNGEEVETPLYDFKTSKPKDKGLVRRLDPNGVIVAEGIFCLNDQLTAKIPAEKKFKIYMSPMSQLNLDENSYFSNQRLRVLRRICRDKTHRNQNAEQTITRWTMVRQGEERNIFPFMNDVDLVFNSSLAYEIPVLSVFVLPLLRTVGPDSIAYRTARQLISFLENFEPIPAAHVPSTSLLREFIGGSDFDD
eukprot:c14853_g1_i2.p1 GENE.c14853_g1_i2~~c14853_g1_i2.p1  ORF type:complete len:596 (-),score=166.61 c14853_g1_i2:13-1584(-)